MENRDFTVQGATVSISCPYAPGHTLSEIEAVILNAARAKQIASKLGGKFKKEQDEEGNYSEAAMEKLAALVAEFDSTFDLALPREASGEKETPVDVEARKLARTLINGKIQDELKLTIKAYKDKKGEDAYYALVESTAQNPAIRKIAEKNVAAAAKALAAAEDTQIDLNFAGSEDSSGSEAA